MPFPAGQLPDPATLLHGLPPPPSLIGGSAGLRFPFGASGRPGGPLDPFSLVSMQRKLSLGQPPLGIPTSGTESVAPGDSPSPRGAPQQNMYEMATMQNEVNTHEMVVKVKGLLAENNIAQKGLEVLFIQLEYYLFILVMDQHIPERGPTPPDLKVFFCF